MKKSLIILAFAAALTVSCKDAKEEPVTPGNIVPENEGELYDAEQAKAKFQDAAVAALDLVNPDDFKLVADLVEFLIDEIAQSDLSAVEENLYEALETIGGQDSSYESIYKGNDQYYTYEYTADWLFTLAPFTGKYTLRNGKWTVEDADNLVIIAPDAAGKDCVFTLDKSSKTTDVMFADFEKNETVKYENSNWMGWDPVTGEDIYGDYYETNYEKERIEFVLPEKINMTLVDNGQTMLAAEITTKADINGILFPDYFPDNQIIENGVLSISSKIDVAGYSFICDRIKSEKNDMSVLMNVKKGGTNAITLTASSGNLKVTERTWTDEDGRTRSEAVYEIDKLEIGADVMGKLQVSGNMDIVPLTEQTDKFYDAVYGDKPEADCFKYIDEANKYMDLGVYFGSKERQASILLKGEIENGEYGRDGIVSTILEFSDKSRYSFEDYFNEKDFKKVIDIVEDLMESFVNMFPLED